jgi:hypothetical protein
MNAMLHQRQQANRVALPQAIQICERVLQLEVQHMEESSRSVCVLPNVFLSEFQHRYYIYGSSLPLSREEPAFYWPDHCASPVESESISKGYSVCALDSSTYDVEKVGLCPKSHFAKG